MVIFALESIATAATEAGILITGAALTANAVKLVGALKALAAGAAVAAPVVVVIVVVGGGYYLVS